MIRLKKFLRSVHGKIITFCLCILRGVSFVMSFASVVTFNEYGISYRDKKTVVSDMVANILISRTERYAEEYRSIKNIVDSYGTIEHRCTGSNLIFEIKDRDGNILVTPDKDDKDSDFSQDTPYTVIYAIYGNGSYSVSTIVDAAIIEDFDFGDKKESRNDFAVMESSPAEDASGDTDVYYFEGAPVDILTVKAQLRSGLPVLDEFKFMYFLVNMAYALGYGLVFICALSAVICFVLFIMLMWASARREEDEEFHRSVLDYIPYDLLIVLTFGIWILSAAGCSEMLSLRDISASFVMILLISTILIIIVGCTGLILLMNTARRIKQKRLIKSTVVYYICRPVVILARKLWKIILAMLDSLVHISLVWKAALGIIVLSATELFIIVQAGSKSVIALFWLLKEIILVPFLIWAAVCMKRLQKAGREISSGNLDYQTDTTFMALDFKEHAQNLNSLSEGMAKATEEKIKSERMKAELVTNVSHDIKTPLTSIINYSILIGKEETENNNIHEYADVLKRKAVQLKRLLEDLVEASRASTGALDVNLEKGDASMFIDQAAGEYEEKLEQADLTLVTEKPDEPVYIMSDSRRMWRVFDNLMNNICKYSQSGTRVYLSLKKEEGNAVVTFRNTSKRQLNISEEELMERFVRGDSSRTTEGSGLGLSIAKSLAELQGGSLKILIDADLFKAILTFPLCDE